MTIVAPFAILIITLGTVFVTCISWHQTFSGMMKLTFNSPASSLLLLLQRILTCRKAGSIMREGRDRVVNLAVDRTGRMLACHVSTSQAEIAGTRLCLPEMRSVILSTEMSFPLVLLRIHSVVLRGPPMLRSISITTIIITVVLIISSH